MRQVFRLMGMPDRVIAFDELPSDLVAPFEKFNCHKLPKDWREFIGLSTVTTQIKPELDPLTRQWIKHEPIVEKGYYAYIVDWEINKDKEAWGAIENYVKRFAPKDFRLMDKIVDMAKPMAADAHAELSLDPEEVVVIPIPKEEKPEDNVETVSKVEEVKPILEVKIESTKEIKCEVCGKVFEKKQQYYNHKYSKHKKNKEATPV